MLQSREFDIMAVEIGIKWSHVQKGGNVCYFLSLDLYFSTLYTSGLN